MNEKRNTGRQIKYEFLLFGICLLLSFAVVLFSVLKYQDGLKDLFSQLHIVLLGAIIVYVLVLLYRLLFWSLLKLIEK